MRRTAGNRRSRSRLQSDQRVLRVGRGLGAQRKMCITLRCVCKRACASPHRQLPNLLKVESHIMCARRSRTLHSHPRACQPQSMAWWTHYACAKRCDDDRILTLHQPAGAVRLAGFSHSIRIRYYTHAWKLRKNMDTGRRRNWHSVVHILTFTRHGVLYSTWDSPRAAQQCSAGIYGSFFLCDCIASRRVPPQRVRPPEAWRPSTRLRTMCQFDDHLIKNPPVHIAFSVTFITVGVLLPRALQTHILDAKHEVRFNYAHFTHAHSSSVVWDSRTQSDGRV